MTPNREQSAASPSVAAALYVAIASGMVLLLGELLDAPVEVALTAAGALLVSSLTVGLMVARRARQERKGFWRSLGIGVRASLRWIWYLAP
jgi:Flp pilus assembly protein TadB